MAQVELSTRRQLELMQELQQLADARAASERQVAETLQTELTEAETEREQADNQLRQESQRRRLDLENEYAAARQKAAQDQREAKQVANQECETQQAEVQAKTKRSIEELQRRKQEAEWEALAVYDAGKDLPGKRLAETLQRLEACQAQLEGLQRDANTLLAMRGLEKFADAAVASGIHDSQAGSAEAATEATLRQEIDRIRQSVVDMQAQSLPAMILESSRWVAWWLGATLISVAILAPFVGLSWWLPLFSLLAGGALAGAFYGLFVGRAIKQSMDRFVSISDSLFQAKQAQQAVSQAAQDQCQQETKALLAQRDNELTSAESRCRQAIDELQQQSETALQEAAVALETGTQRATQEFQQAIATADEVYGPQLEEFAAERDKKFAAIDENYQTRIKAAQTAHDTQWQALADGWLTGFERIAGELSAMQQACAELFPDWAQQEWSSWSRPELRPGAMQFGTYRLPLQAVKHGVPADPRLVPPQTELQIPALLNFAEQPGLIITSEGRNPPQATEAMRAMMLRMLTTVPAGRLRFTIIDPTGLGENFATFMHLADFDEQLVGGKILTDSRQIEQRLTQLSDHLEKVLQKYLRNEFESLEAYNEQAGEVAEPYHVVVVANYPSGLSDAAMRRLKTIAQTGPACGVYTMMGIDGTHQFSADFQLAELLQNVVHLHCQEDRLIWNYPLYEKLPLEPDALPPRETFTELLHQLARESRDASRVEVPFEAVAPGEQQFWQSSSAHGLEIPIGRAGAKELQSVRLGRGTSQHLLISGKTGSGKSTLLHALITNAALHYSPRELEFYLVDFKKGVEFKTYASGQLPHARVIAIESEREFGVSVLERLDDELRRRGELFREQGVQDLAGFRSACSDPMPREVLIVDEFQELFVVDDKLAQDAALLLDRLVRQGRAFGIHVILGSQTLAGTYSLARSTLGQMAVRIALECSDADAHLILSDENTAARLLSRPGEAIYNDQNGLVDGNSLFQVVWLTDSERRQYLDSLREPLSQLEYERQSAIVFEGNVAADPAENKSLVSMLSDSAAAVPNEPNIWLGSSVRIGPATQLSLRKQGGSNLLVVGQDEALAVGILSSALWALAAQRASADLRVVILDGCRGESPYRGIWNRVVSTLACEVKLCGSQEVSETIRVLAAEQERRTTASNAQAPTCIVLAYDLAQLRDLRISEDEFSFSNRSSNGHLPAVDKQFRELLREGPAVGMHTLMWADSYNSVSRCIDRRSMREIDFRVALQMSPADSTSLIDSKVH